MGRIEIIVITALVLGTLFPSMASAWDVVYDGSVLPNDPALGDAAWLASGDMSMANSDGSVLHMADVRSDAYLRFVRWPGLPARTPVTIEARVRVASGRGVYLSVGEVGFSTWLGLTPDRIEPSFGYSSAGQAYYADLSSEFRCIRVGIDSLGQAYVWLDGVLVAQGNGTTPQGGGIGFGASSYDGLSESYWDYVAYSNAFLPVAEPSALVALLTGLGGFGFAFRRRV